jgi:sec-independent protein translocase protein TatC
MSNYINLISSVTLATGLLFQLPIVVYFLSRLSIVTPDLLKKYRRHAIVIILSISAIITPPDITSQVLVTVPVVLLYQLSIFISRRVIKKAKAANE